MKTLIFISVLAALFTAQAKAEYRVYQYQVLDLSRKGLKGSANKVTTTLNPVSYISYHGGGNSTKVSLLRSWQCFGHTGEKIDFCKPPLERLEEMTLNEN